MKIDRQFLTQAAVNLVVVAAVLAAGWSFVIGDMQKRQRRAMSEERHLRDEFLAKWSKANQLDQYRGQIEEMESEFANVLRLLPSDVTPESSHRFMVEASEKLGGRITGFEAQPTLVYDFYAEHPYSVSLVMDFESLMGLLEWIENHPRLATTDELAILAREEGLGVQFTLKEFSYVEFEE